MDITTLANFIVEFSNYYLKDRILVNGNISIN